MNIRLIFVTLLGLSFFTQTMQIYEITMNTISTNKVERFPAHMVTDKQPYVNGGLVFSYPAGLFTSPPVISVTISTTLPEKFIAEITSDNWNFATVTVYKFDILGPSTEALTGEVTVHFMAIGT